MTGSGTAPTRVRIGQSILMFGSVAEVLAVDRHPGFPYALLITLRPRGHEPVRALVPADLEPVVVSGDASAALCDALAMERLRFQVAIAIVGLLGDRVDDGADQAVVIDDVVRHWLALTPERQDSYRRADSPFSALTEFAWAYVDRVSAEAFTRMPQGGLLETDEAISIEVAHWAAHTARLRDERESLRSGPALDRGHAV